MRTVSQRTSAGIISRVAAFVLRGRANPSCDPALSDGQWAALTNRMTPRHLSSFLQAATEAGALPVTDEQAEQVARQTAQARPDFEKRFAKGTILSGQAGDEPEPHCSLVLRTCGYGIDRNEPFASSQPLTVGNHEMCGPEPDTRLPHACGHAGLGHPVPRYNRVLDVAAMPASSIHDPRRVLTLCADLPGFQPDGAVTRSVAGYVPACRERCAADSCVGDNRRLANKAIASVPSIDGLCAKSALLQTIVAPQEGVAESSDGRLGASWICRGVRSLLPWGHS